MFKPPGEEVVSFNPVFLDSDSNGEIFFCTIERLYWGFFYCYRRGNWPTFSGQRKSRWALQTSGTCVNFLPYRSKVNIINYNAILIMIKFLITGNLVSYCSQVFLNLLSVELIESNLMKFICRCKWNFWQ